MASRVERNTREAGRRQDLELNNEKVRPQGIKKKVASPRKSARIESIQRAQERTNTESTKPLPFPKTNTSETNAPGKESLSAPLQEKDRKRKRAQGSEEPRVCARGPEDSHVCAPSTRPHKRRQTSVVGAAAEDTCDEEQEKNDGIDDRTLDPVDYWVETGRWHEQYFKQDDQVRKDFKSDFEKDSWYEKYWVPNMNMNTNMNTSMNTNMHMIHLLARKKSSSSLRGKRPVAGSDATSSNTPSDQKPKAVKNTSYQDARYPTLLATKGSFMGKSTLGIADGSKALCQTLLEKEQTVPQGSLFRDDLFEEVCEMIQDRNEAKVVQDVSRLIVPSAETLAIFGATHLKILIESVNEGWNNSIPITDTRPQPDYATGFRRGAFTEDQLKRLEPFVGDLFSDTSFFMATYNMYFPFLTCEVKCGATALDIADRQNAHSTTMAVRGVVELFRLVKREQELHRELLAFSISHDHRTVRIYGHYPIIKGKETAFYRYPIHTFDFTALNGREKWTAYKFTKNVYDIWMPAHLKRICSVIDELPLDINFEVSEHSELGMGSGISQGLESHHLSDQSSQSSHVPSRDITPGTSLSQNIERGEFKLPKKRERPAELHQS